MSVSLLKNRRKIKYIIINCSTRWLHWFAQLNSQSDKHVPKFIIIAYMIIQFYRNLFI